MEMKMVQDKVLLDKCWASNWELHTEANLALIKDKGWYYQVDTLVLLGFLILRAQGLERVILFAIKK